MKFRPLHDRVLVRRLEEEEKTSGGVIIPDTAKEKPMEGEIIAVGSGARSEDGKITPLDVKQGDKILFGKWSGTEVKLDGEGLCGGGVGYCEGGGGDFDCAIWGGLVCVAFRRCCVSCLEGGRCCCRLFVGALFSFVEQGIAGGGRVLPA